MTKEARRALIQQTITNQFMPEVAREVQIFLGDFKKQVDEENELKHITGQNVKVAGRKMPTLDLRQPSIRLVENLITLLDE